jgi:hypothetical protein
MVDALDKVEEKIKADLSWLQRHERLVLAVIAGLALWFAIGKVDTLIADHDNANLQQAKVIAQVQEEKNQALAAQVAQQAADYKALADKVNAQNAALEQANVNLANALVQRQKTDASLPPTELVARMNALVPAAGATVTPTGVSLPQAGAVAVTQELEKVPSLAARLDNEVAEVTADQKLIDAGVVQVRTLNEQVTGLKLKAVDDAKVCQAQVAVVKAEARKAKRKWFVIGWVTGFLSRQTIKSYTGF